jgi:macrolide-specific efflux system membrane fusion protein
VNLQSLQVKVGFSEADAVKVKAGQPAVITFDSLPSTRLTGKVASIDLTSTTTGNVVTYNAYIPIDRVPTDNSVKPGMTASVQVTVQQAQGVVSLPASAVLARGTNATVQVETGDDPKVTTTKNITVGLRGDETIEITSGLNVGDKVVVTRTTGATASGTGATATRTGTGAGVTGGVTGGAGFGGGGFGGGGARPGG